MMKYPMIPPLKQIAPKAAMPVRHAPVFDDLQPSEEERDNPLRCKHLEESFDPKVNNPPTPIFDHRQMRTHTPKQLGNKTGDTRGRRHKQGDKRFCRPLALGSGMAARPIRNSHNSRPTKVPPARRGQGRRTRNPDASNQNHKSLLLSLCITLIHCPPIEPSTTISSVPNKTSTPELTPVPYHRYRSV
ncbi:MAG: hypothetical protein IPG58_17325 [Acidobacteria bacterium]|nr:hypothetical protein [Acidobacteriota bacterium]